MHAIKFILLGASRLTKLMNSFFQHLALFSLTSHHFFRWNGNMRFEHKFLWETFLTSSTDKTKCKAFVSHIFETNHNSSNNNNSRTDNFKQMQGITKRKFKQCWCANWIVFILNVIVVNCFAPKMSKIICRKKNSLYHQHCYDFFLCDSICVIFISLLLWFAFCWHF